MLINKISLKLDKYRFGYDYFVSDNYPLYVLGIYLTSEYGLTCERIKDSSILISGGNLTKFEKCGDNIRMWLKFDRELYEDDPEHWILIISINKLIKVTEEWGQIVKNKPEYIIITEYNDEYAVIDSEIPHKLSQSSIDYENALKAVIKCGNDTYSIVFNREYKFINLAQFLIQDASVKNSFEDWAKNSNEKIVSKNRTVLEKNGDYVLLYLQCDIDKYKAYPEQYSLSIEIDQFIYILGKWNRLLLKKPNFILIKEDIGRYEVIAFRRNPTVPVDIEDLYDDDAEDD